MKLSTKGEDHHYVSSIDEIDRLESPEQCLIKRYAVGSVILQILGVYPICTISLSFRGGIWKIDLSSRI